MSRKSEAKLLCQLDQWSDDADRADWAEPIADRDLTDYCGLQADLADCDDEAPF